MPSRPATAALLFAALHLACAGTGSPIELDRFRGVYTTHFDGIPDRAAVCAVVSNRGTTAQSWVKLRLESRSQLGEKPGRWISRWLWKGHLAAGKSVVLELPDPPVADQIALTVSESGSGRVPSGARRARRSKECSERSLEARLDLDARGRTAIDRTLVSAVRRNDGVDDDEVLVAEAEQEPSGPGFDLGVDVLN